MEVLARNNVNVLGTGDRTILLGHGFGCDQTMWRWIAPALAQDHRVVLFDYVGAGRSDRAAYDAVRYGSLSGYAADAIDVCEALGARGAVWIGHSISSMIGALASVARPDLFERLVMVAPSPRFLDDPPDYRGGFGERDISDLLDLMDHNFMGWATSLASMAVPSEDLSGVLRESFTSIDPRAARQFAEITFRCDLRDVLPRVAAPTLVLQCAHDDIAPVEVGEYTRRRLPRADYRLLDVAGHCPHMSHPDEVLGAVREFLRAPPGGPLR